MNKEVFEGNMIFANDGKMTAFKLIQREADSLFSWKGSFSRDFVTQNEAIAFAKDNDFKVISVPIVDVYLMKYENAILL